MGIVPDAWMPNCSMKRIITHWTAGAHKASALDKAHYHILIEGDGNLVRGTHTIKNNVSTGDNVYAAHTWRWNTGSIGVSVCCMAGAKSSPFSAGGFPMTKKQWETMAKVVSELCMFYNIDVTKKTVLGHGEVKDPDKLNTPQGGKWDPMVLPWDTSLSFSEVGDRFRSLVKENLTGEPGMLESPAGVTAIVQGKTFREAQIFNEKSIIKIRPLVDTFDGTILNASADGVLSMTLEIAGGPISYSFLLIDHGNSMVDIPPGISEEDLVSQISKFGFVKVTDLADALNLSVMWDGGTRTVTLS